MRARHAPSLLLLSAVLLVSGAGCVTPTGDPWTRLRAGMSYAEVQRLVGPGDAELSRGLQEAGDQQRAMEREYWEIRARAKQAGGVWIPPMTSEVTVASGDRRLEFKDGRLFSWEPR
ncbi:MAG: hypothetical protein J0L84_15975 [Verrucomicrobia bacterium]|nr:hypothetical protein [Verrucomicrobiota bacterium]